jgi:MoaD family protein
VVYVCFYANMRTITGQSEVEIPISTSTTLGELLAGLEQRFPALRYTLLNEQGRLYADIPIFVNGRNPRLAGAGMLTPLNQDDVVTFFSPIASGRINVEEARASTNGMQEPKE